MSGLAAQASDTANGAKGGVITIEALLDVDLKGSTTEAKGATSGGGGQKGGTVNVRSFTMNILTDGTSKIDVTDGNPANGTVTLKACLTIGFPPGTVVPAAITPSKTTGLAEARPLSRAGSPTSFCPVSAVVAPRQHVQIRRRRAEQDQARRRPAEGAGRGAVGPGQWKWRRDEL